MKLLSPTTLLGVALAATLASCSSISDLGGAMGGMAGGGGNAALDTAKNVPAMNVMALPPAPAVGQSWTMDMSGMKTTTAIVAEMDGQFILEQETSMYGEPIILAYQVDPRVDMTAVPAAGEKMTSNVTAAWIGVEGEKPLEHTVMEAMTMPETTGEAAPAMDFTTGNETVSLGGRSWDATWTEAGDSKSWMAGNFILRSDYDGKTVMQITDWQSNAEPKLDWTPAE
ncbi:hypothetical protein Poly30_16020 [Planctomycetes bacterium Poly30]|uniref:Lipoprotein n=1 Tax=Saltatorellus ferox TaxID=2528018 RepID=A0A518EPU2_9BACT|nr:hypothetical protein Poly30_16020 [Planctomycetes bacterium Poly30]